MKIELKRAIFNKYFLWGCIFGIIIIFLHSYSIVVEYNSVIPKIENAVIKGINPLAPTINVFTSWIGWNSENKYSKLFFALMPFISVIPYFWSYCDDIKKGKANVMIEKNGKFNYHLTKYFATFISSGLTIAIPLLLDFLILLLFVPAVFPDSVYDIYYGIFSNDFMANTFYTNPLLYVFVFLLLNFTYCGLFGCIGYSVSTLIKNKVISLIAPIVFILLTEFIKNKVISDVATQRNNFSPLTFLCPAKSINTNWIIIILEIISLFIVTFYCSVLRYTKKDKNIEDKL